MMRASVIAGFQGFNARFEGVCKWMYLDVKGLVTCAVGNLIDSPAAAIAYPWVLPDGTPANPSDILHAWQTVKAATSMARLGGGHFAALTRLRLTDAGVAQAVAVRRDMDWSFLLHRFPSLPTWPADAQMGVLSIAWAAGPGWVAPHFDMYANCQTGPEFVMMAKEAWLNEDAGGVHNAGLHPRNLANQTLFMNSDRVVNGTGYDPDDFYYPRVLS